MNKQINCDLMDCKDCCYENPHYPLEDSVQCSKIRNLWEEFGDIPMNPDTECIEVEWNGFASGTHREEIWHWFEETFNTSVAKLMYKE